MISPFIHFALILIGLNYSSENFFDTNFRSDRIDAGIIEFEEITEASGIAASRQQKNVFWIHNDSGDSPRVLAVSATGRHLGQYRLKRFRNRDWEDVAIGPGPVSGISYLYIGDIGDNSARHEYIQVHRIVEPKVDTGQPPTDTMVRFIDTITLLYPDGPRDAETLMIDPTTRDLYIVSKREERVGVYVARYPQSIETPMVLERVSTLPFPFATAGEISPSGDGILIKSYTHVYYWPRKPGQTVEKALSHPPSPWYYEPEPQGEALCWQADGKGYYTTSEEAQGIEAHLYYYPVE